MQQKTRDHIEVAQGNRQFAVWVSHPAPDRPDQSNAWGVVAAFYGAVHIVNAYIWESHGIELTNHHHRGRHVDRDPLLAHVRDDYRRLASLGWTARYDPTARISLVDVHTAIVHLDHVIETIFGEIDQQG